VENRLSGHSVYRTEYHVVWIPKYRRRILNSGVKEYLDKLWPKILKGIPGVEMIEKNIQVDHIHTIIIIPPKYSVSDVIGRIKGQSASKLRKKFLSEGAFRYFFDDVIVWFPLYHEIYFKMKQELDRIIILGQRG
jgi:putative transposase